MAVFRLSRRLRAERADDSLSDSQFAVLAHLSGHGPYTLGALADRERVTAPSMHRSVSRLEESGYVRREPDPTDGRRVLVLLTPAGEELIAETARMRNAWLVAALEALNDDERHALQQAIPILEAIANR